MSRQPFAILTAQPPRFPVRGKQLWFVCSVFVPATILYFLPLLMYKIPLTVALYDRTVLVDRAAVFRALLACAVWFSVATGLALWRATPVARPRPWDPAMVSAAFAGFSLIGGAASVAASLCALPPSIGELMHWMALTPAVGVVLGVYLLRQPQYSVMRAWRRVLIWAAIILDLLLMVVVPVMLAKVTPAAVAGVVIFYGLTEVGVSTRRLLIAAILSCCLAFAALPFKEFLRSARYNGTAFVPRACSVNFSRRAAASTGSSSSRLPGGTAGVSGGSSSGVSASVPNGAGRALSDAIRGAISTGPSSPRLLSGTAGVSRNSSSVASAGVPNGAGRALSDLPPAASPLVKDIVRASHAYLSAAIATSPETLGLRWRRFHGVSGVIEFSAERAVNRLNRFGDLAYVLAQTPSHVPFAQGATYAPILTTIVPRVLWPRKPLNDGGGQFYGHRYDFLDPSDTIHDVNLPVLTEGWVNWGWAGVVISAIAVGLLLRVVWCRWIGDSGAPGNILIGMTVLAAAVDQESNLALMVGGVIHALVLFGVLECALRGFRRLPFRKEAPSVAVPSSEAIA